METTLLTPMAYVLIYIVIMAIIKPLAAMLIHLDQADYSDVLDNCYSINEIEG